MSAGIAAAMVKAACEHQSVQTQVVAEEALELLSFFPSCCKPQKALEQTLSIELYQCTDSSCNGRHQTFIV